ncbi:MAG: TusE/DsrC/DsvC family sulfur relay protein [Magnetococcus sp. YQC-3]
MIQIELNHRKYDLNKNGYLVNEDDWNEELASHIAKLESITMSNAHWQVIYFIRSHYKKYRIAPMIRMVIVACVETYGIETANRKYLQELFPGGLAQQACRIAGLPQSTGCV